MLRRKLSSIALPVLLLLGNSLGNTGVTDPRHANAVAWNQPVTDTRHTDTVTYAVAWHHTIAHIVRDTYTHC